MVPLNNFKKMSSASHCSVTAALMIDVSATICLENVAQKEPLNGCVPDDVITFWCQSPHAIPRSSSYTQYFFSSTVCCTICFWRLMFDFFLLKPINNHFPRCFRSSQKVCSLLWPRSSNFRSTTSWRCPRGWIRTS